MKDDAQHGKRGERVVGTLTLHVRLKRDAELLRDAAEKGISAAAALWHSVSGCRAWLEYRAQGLRVTYSARSEGGPARDLELNMVGDFSTSRELEASEERAFFEAVAREFDAETRRESPPAEGNSLRLMTTLWKEATGESLVPDVSSGAVDARRLIVAIERLNREGLRRDRSQTDGQGWSYEH